MGVPVEIDEAKHRRLHMLASVANVAPGDLLDSILGGYLDSTDAAIASAGGKVKQKSPDYPSLYRWDDVKGIVSFAPTKRRVLLFTAHAWGILEDSLESTLLKAADPFLFEMGCVYGKALALDYGSVTDDPERLRGYFEYLGLAAGWGRMTLSGDLRSGSKVTVKVENCVFCKSRNLSVSRARSCQFLLGVAKGIVDTVFDSWHSATEPKCTTRGDECCEIVLVAERRPERKAGEWVIGAQVQPQTA
jgi:predicted hydrocarbon binding protein